MGKSETATDIDKSIPEEFFSEETIVSTAQRVIADINLWGDLKKESVPQEVLVTMKDIGMVDNRHRIVTLQSLGEQSIALPEIAHPLRIAVQRTRDQLIFDLFEKREANEKKRLYKELNGYPANR